MTTLAIIVALASTLGIFAAPLLAGSGELDKNADYAAQLDEAAGRGLDKMWALFE